MLGHCQTVCVHPVFPFGKDEPTKLVLAELAKRNIKADVCKQEQAVELYFYPLNVSLDTGETFFSVNVQSTSSGIVGTVSTAKLHWDDQVWVVSVHPWGQEDSTKRELGFSLKSQVKKIAKWLNRGA